MKISQASLVAIPRIRHSCREPGIASVPAGRSSALLRRSSVPDGRTSGVVSRRLGGGCRPSGIDSLPSGASSLPSVPPALSSGVASRRLGFSRRILRFSFRKSLNSLNTSNLHSHGLAATQSSTGVSPARRTSGYANKVAGAVGACRSAVAVHVASRRWLSFFR